MNGTRSRARPKDRVVQLVKNRSTILTEPSLSRRRLLGVLASLDEDFTVAVGM
jgi:hypothetical protein